MSEKADCLSFELYLKEISCFSRLRPEEEVEVGRRARAGDPIATERLVQANLHIVVSMAQRFGGFEISMEDLVAEGNYGLLRALDSFDPDEGKRFASHSHHLVRHAMQNAARHAPIVQRTRRDIARAKQIRREAARMAQRQGSEPGFPLIAAHMGLPVDEVAKAFRNTRPRSLDAPLGNGTSLREMLDDPGAPRPDAGVQMNERTACVERVLELLPLREAYFVSLYFGLGGSPPKRMQEIAEEAGVTRTRVGQVIKTALNRIRHPSRVRLLEPWR
jgi:RNA polymerase primary sigma factor